MSYRISRNLEASLIDWLTEELEDAGWTGIRIEKAFAEIYRGTLPAICINVIDISPEKLEIGSKTNLKYFTVNIRIFALNDGQRLDLSDWLLDLLEDDINYYSYVITNGQVASKDLTGKIVIRTITRMEKELTNTEGLAKEDKYRHLIEFICFVAK